MKNEKWIITVGELESSLSHYSEHAEMWIEIKETLEPILGYGQLEDGRFILKTE